MAEWKGPSRARGGTLRRFVSPKIHLGDYEGLPADNPAVVEGRTLFPTTVVLPLESPALFVSGAHNSKLGGRVMKGALKGMPIFHLTLEERKTCPSSCVVWRECYGNGMHMARRHEAFDPFFLPALRAQAGALARAYPNGVLIRLHTLGDFFSVEYVEAWAEILDAYRNIHTFGYTARDPVSDPIGDAVLTLSMEKWDRFAIRFSGGGLRPRGSTTFHQPPEPHDALIMCPAQAADGDEAKTDCCATCGICWSPSARDKCIGFLIHGLRRRARSESQRGVAHNHKISAQQDRLWKVMLAAADGGGVVRRGLADLADDAGVVMDARYSYLKALVRHRVVRVLRKGNRGAQAVYQVFAEPQAKFPPAPLVPAPAKKAKAVVPRDRGFSSNIPNAVAPDRRGVARVAGDRPKMNPSSFIKPHDSKGRLVRPWLIGTADQFEIGTAEQRIAAVDEAEKKRIAEMYGAKFK